MGFKCIPHLSEYMYYYSQFQNNQQQQQKESPFFLSLPKPNKNVNSI